eukprot:Sspe_Gene.89217::Locus_61039_Transcript_4_8_Confidence_0.650_Length_899::g.89217::m.89217
MMEKLMQSSTASFGIRSFTGAMAIAALLKDKVLAKRIESYRHSRYVHADQGYLTMLAWSHARTGDVAGIVQVRKDMAKQGIDPDNEIIATMLVTALSVAYRKDCSGRSLGSAEYFAAASAYIKHIRRASRTVSMYFELLTMCPTREALSTTLDMLSRDFPSCPREKLFKAKLKAYANIGDCET